MLIDCSVGSSQEERVVHSVSQTSQNDGSEIYPICLGSSTGNCRRGWSLGQNSLGPRGEMQIGGLYMAKSVIIFRIDSYDSPGEYPWMSVA